MGEDGGSGRVSVVVTLVLSIKAFVNPESSVVALFQIFPSLISIIKLSWLMDRIVSIYGLMPI